MAINSQLLAQTLPSRNLSLQQGLPEYFVSGIVQDRAGFIWVATRDGLARYDGRQFKVFRHQPFSNRSLANNVILLLESVSDSTLLLHLENGNFQLFNPITERFTNLLNARQVEQNRIKLANVLLSDERQVWGRHQTQLIHFDRSTKQFNVYPFPQLPNPKNQFPGNSIFLDSKRQHLYAPFPGQLVEFDTHHKAFKVWPEPRITFQGKIETYYGTHLLQRANGEILISAVKQLLVFNPQNHQFRAIPIPGTIDTKAGILYQANDRNIYFTYGMTVYRLTTDDRITPIWTASRMDYQNYFHALLIDNSGVLWIGTNGDGIQQIDLRASPIKTYPYRTNFVQDVLSAELGLSVPRWAQSNSHLYRLRLDGKLPYATISIDNTYQLLRGDRQSRTLKPILQLPDTKDLTGVEGGNAVRVLSDGTIWMYDPKRGLLKADLTGRLLDTFACPVRWVMAIQPIGSWVWLGSQESGLYAYDTEARRIIHHVSYQPANSASLISSHVLCMLADPTNPALLWIGTQEGLARLDTRTGRFQNWTEKEGLPSTTIYTLLTDRRGNLWFSTGKGISRMNPRTGKFRHFSTTDGLLDIEYRQDHALQLPDGRLAFGGATGITVFDPLALHEQTQPIPTVLTGLRLANVPVESGQDRSPLTLPLNAMTTLRLQPTQNFLSLEFAGLQYNKPASLHYRYQLTNVDANWVYSGSRNVANYTNLAPGNYEFRVNTADADGHWSPLIKTLRIIIDPPWWQTWWAYLLYALLMAVMIRAYTQYRISQAQLRQEVLLKQREAQLVRENADWQTRFFTNITHEFRTPLTLIISPLERLMEPSTKLSRSMLHQQLGLMYRNAQRLLGLINQLLDLAKLEVGQLTLTESQGNLPAFFAGLVDSFQLRAEQKGVQLACESSGLEVDYCFDAQKLETIGYNLLANAVKFTDRGGHVQVSVLEKSMTDGHSALQLRVADTGCGIPAEQLSRIFERFYQGSNAEASVGTGTGIGLFLVAEFTKLMGGSVTVDSQVGQGTTFTVTLPLRKADSLQPVVVPVLSEAVAHPELRPEWTNVPVTAPLVLVVEDNDELREFIAGELAGKYRVFTAANGQEGWQLCLDELPELVISDVMMPLVDGITLVNRIKTTPLTAHIAVILLTAKTMTDSRIQGLSVGANDYLTKPFNVQELQLRLRNLLHHQQQLRQHWQQQISQLGEVKAPVSVDSLSIDDPFLLKLYEVLDSQLSNPTFRVEQLADELAVSQRTLHRKLSMLTGSTANELVRSYRLRKAAVLLQAGASVSEAAEKVGFEDLSYFTKVFKAQFAVTPSSYQQAQKN